MKSLLELIKLIFGPKALSKTIGTRTNVIKLPNNEIKRYTKTDLNIEAASDKLTQQAYKEMEELIPDIPKMNDAERLIFEGNLRRLKNRLGIRSETDPTAEVFQFETKEKVTPGGIASLTEKAGQKSPPGTLMGNIESRIKQLEASGKELEDIAKEKGGMDFGKIMDDYAKQQEKFLKIQDSGLVTSTAREILQRDIKAGKLKLPKEIEDRIMLVDGNPGTVNPVEVFRTNYGEDALEQIDSLIPELAKAQSYSDLVKIVEKKYPMKPLAKPRKETMDLDEAMKAEQEYMLTPEKTIPADSPEGKKITEKLIGKPKAKVTELLTAEKIIADMNKMDPMDAMYEANKVLKKEGKYKNLKDEDVQKIMSETEDNIFERNFPEEPEDFATGGRVGYSDGTKPSAEENTPSQEIINRMMAQIKQMSKMGADIDTIKTITGASDQMIKDVLGKASGGRMSKGLDYLTGIERPGYAQGTLLSQYQKHLADITAAPLQSTVIPPLYINDGGDSSTSFTRPPTKEESEATLTEGMTDVGENKGFGGILGTLAGFALSGLGGKFGKALSMGMSALNPNSIARQTLSGITNAINLGFNPFGSRDFTTGDSIDNQVDVEAMDRDQAGDPGGTSQAESEAGMSEGMSDLADGGIVRKKYANGTYLEEDAARTTYDQILGQFLANRGDDPNFVHIVDPDISNILGVEAKDLWIPKHIAPFYEQKKQEYLSQQVPRSDLNSTTLSNTSPLQQHFDQNQLLKNAVASGQITPEQYNELGGYDVTQTMAGGNPVIGGIGNLLGSLGYNVVQSIAGDQPFSDIPGDVYRNVKGGLGLISPELKQTYQDIVQQRFPTYQQDLENYRQRQAAVDPNQIKQSYLQNLQNTGTTNVGEFQSKLQSNLTTPRTKNADGGLNYLMGY